MTLSQAEAAKSFADAGITTRPGKCSDPRNPKCTSLELLPRSVVDGVKKLKNDCNCNFYITGGTETGHKSHGFGEAKVDLSWEIGLRSFLKTLKQQGRLGDYGIKQVCTIAEDKAEVSYRCDNFTEQTRHFHLTFN